MPQDSVQTNYNHIGTLIMESMYGHDFLSPGGLDACRTLVGFGQIHNRQRVLDVGCGLGGAAGYMASTLKCRVHGIDLVQENIAEATRRASRNGLDQLLDFVVGDAAALPFAEAEFDVVWGQDAWCHVADKAQLLAEVRRVLKAGGRLVFSDWLLGTGSAAEHANIRDITASPGMADLHRYQSLLSQHGFVDVQERDNTRLMVERYTLCMKRLAEMELPLKDVYGGRVYDVVWRKQSQVMSAFTAGNLRALAFVAQG
ncbi:MAG: methyltransferase domain-containing protein [Pseudomonadota bacterium]